MLRVEEADMATQIKDPETDRLVKRYAKLHRTSPEQAVRRAVGDALLREGHPLEERTPEERERIKADFIATVREIQARVRELPVLDPRHPDDILYDEDGIPK
jgi:antitoxin VapB